MDLKEKFVRISLRIESRLEGRNRPIMPTECGTNRLKLCITDFTEHICLITTIRSVGNRNVENVFTVTWLGNCIQCVRKSRQICGPRLYLENRYFQLKGLYFLCMFGQIVDNIFYIFVTNVSIHWYISVVLYWNLLQF